MERRYKIILSNPNLYKEIELGSQARTLRVGTGIECDVRLHGELFFSPVQLSFSRDSEDVWSVLCTDDLYLGSDSEFDVSKPIRRQLTHGDILHVKYRQSDTLVFTVEFMIDFDSGKLRYERFIDIGSEDEIIIGTDPGSHIVLTGEYAEKERVVLYRTAGGLRLEVRETTYGVYHNGRKVEQSVALNNMDYFSVSDYFFYYRDKVLYAEIRPDMTVNRLSKKDRPSNPAYPRFNRSTRIQEKVNEEAIEILDPPPKPQKPKNNLVTRLLPAMGMLIAAGVMAYFGGMLIIMSAISGTMAVITTLITYRESKKDYQEGTVSRIEKYTAYIEKKREEIQQAREEEKEQLDRIYLSGEEEQRLFDDFSPALFDRSPEDPDFLCVRLGTGDVEARRALEYKKQERLEVEDDLQLMPEQLCEEFRYIEDAPVVCDLKEANAVGVVGSEECRFALLKNIMVDLTARQYCSDVQFAFISSEENAEKIRWLRFLPQVIDPVTDLRMIVTDEESRVTVFECLYRELSAREQKKTIESRLVVFFYDECGFKSHPISKFIENASKLGVCFVFFGRTEADIPLGCDSIVRSDALGQGSLIDAHGEKRTLDFSYSELSTNAAKRVVRLLAPVYTEEISLESSLTRSISMFQMLNIFSASDLDLGSRWASTKVFQSMAAPVGVSKTGIVQLDLHDKAHGPHGLVAGTTGSGKSELLQTYILSMATLFSPTEVGFVIIDFKGGGMANQFRELPHLMGTITNIDGKEIERSLKSIKAELQTRQRLFAEADVNHIDKYIRKYRAGEVVRPLPHLIVVVDEFAELKAEQPEFMKELISAARIGRSLGVHLILATQKPSGQVSEQIWSNSRFKLCLKVQTQEDSNEVLKSPLAAEIKEPGRAYLQVGNNEIFELFQSAYSGASEKVYDDSVRDFSLCSVSDVGKRTVIFKQKSKKPGEDTRSQLDAIVSYVAEYCRTAGVQELPNIFMPPLQSVIDFPADAGVKAAPPVTTVDLGIFDDPENQLQDVYSLDIENQNLMIIGSAQSGKTNLLQTIIRSVAARYTPEEVTLYIIDFASMTLKNFESLKHVGGVVTAAEDEKLRNLFKLLLGEIEVRKNRMLAVGVSSFSAYREAGFTDMPNILVLIDNLTALKETYFQDDTEILRLCREGLSVGISVIVANGQTAGIGYKYLSNFSARIALFCNDPSEYNALFNHCRERVGDVHGRCLIEQDKRFLDCQIYLAFQGEKEIERVEKIRAFVKETNARVTGRARMIPMIPDLLTQSFMSEQFADRMRSQYSVVVGLDYSTVSPVSIPFATQGILAVSGHAHSGKSNFIRYIVKMLEEMYPGRSAVYIVDSVARRLSDLKAAPNVREYGILAGRAAELVCAVAEQLKSRYDALAAGNEEELEKSELLVLIFNTPDAAEAVSADPKALEAFRNILGRYKNLNSFILLGNYENTNVSYNAPEVIKKARDLRQIVFFDDISSMKIVDIPILVQREFRKPIAIGDGYFIHENECVKIKTARVSDQA